MSYQIYCTLFLGLDDAKYSVEHTKGVWLHDGGFWVTVDYKLSDSFDDGYYWIPPHRVIGMTKAGRTEGDEDE